MILKADSKGIQKAVNILEEGGVIAYPTETVYGLGCDPWNKEAVNRIRFLKGRDGNKPMILLIPDIQNAGMLSMPIPEKTRALINTFWPGPLTLVMQASTRAPESILNQDRKIAVRISSDPVCGQLMKKYNHPLVSTSANSSGEYPARSVAEVENYFNDKLDAILDGGTRHISEPSTVVDLFNNELRILRTGAIQSESIQEVWRSS